MIKKSKKFKLEYADMHCLLAIYTVNSDYRLAWLLNVALDIQMQREENTDEISLFSDRKSIAPIQFMLISNKQHIKRLFPQYEQVDYFFKIFNASNELIVEIVAKINQLELVSACSILREDAKLMKALNRL